jgi:hypothetical protein
MCLQCQNYLNYRPHGQVVPTDKVAFGKPHFKPLLLSGCPLHTHDFTLTIMCVTIDRNAINLVNRIVN